MNNLRMAVVKDVLFQIEHDRITVEQGAYYSFAGKKFVQYVGIDGFELPTRECTVCALGALLVSYLRKDNSKFDVIEKAGPMPGYAGAKLIDSILGDIFEPKQIQMIEVAFEGDSLGYCRADLLSEHEQNLCFDFREKYPEAKDRLIGICHNILQNNGTFHPSRG